MPNSKYLRGRNNEYKAMRTLEKDGWHCVRSAGSHGMWDIVAYCSNGIRFIQVKTNGHITDWETKKIKEFSDLPEGSTKEIWQYYTGKSLPIIRVVP